MAFMLTRIDVGDYDAWKELFDQDVPGARRASTGYRILRNVDSPGEVVVLVEFASTGEAQDARTRLADSGVLDRFEDVTGPAVFEQAEAVEH